MSTHRHDSDRRPLAGSARAAAPGARPGPPLDQDAEIEVTVVLRRAASGGSAGGSGADPADVTAVTGALTDAGLTVVRSDPPTRRLRVRGSVRALAATFGTELEQVISTGPDGRDTTHRHRTGELSVPATMVDRVVAVLGLDDRPQARSQVRLASASAASISYTPLQLGELYAFPAGTDGTGQQIAIVELGGGFGSDDLDRFFGELGLATPIVTAVDVDGGTNAVGQDPQGADGEVLLDIEVAGALAPGAGFAVYFAPNTDAGFLDAVSEAGQADPAPAAISISWGQREDHWTAQARTAMDDAFADAVQRGIVVTVAAGDSGSGDGAADGTAHVDFPASSPNVLACGGTSLRGSGSAIASETVWNDGGSGGATGGGVSVAFPRPAWQDAAGVPGDGRGVPDVAGNADPQTGYEVVVDGNSMVIGGTSAVAPLWAGLVARLAQALGGPVPSLPVALYAGTAAGQPAAGLRDVTAGNNGAFSAGPGWDACTGWGSPDGDALLARLQADGPPPDPPTDD